jgi:RHS repeat-associated protein
MRRSTRLLAADYSYDETLASSPFRRYQYTFDLAGNRTQQIVTVNGTPTTTNYTYNAANQLTQAGAQNLTYDHNGNMLNDGTGAYTWDRANRLLTFAGATYKYDGLGNRTQQNTIQYLLDLQLGLSVVLKDSAGNKYVHGLRGIHAQKDAANNWEHMTHDGLGSVRQVFANNLNLLESVHYDPIGTREALYGTLETIFEFTGEQRDGSGFTYLRNRYLNSALGVFPSRDPYEGTMQRPMSLNGYSWVEGNVVNATDASGYITTHTVHALLTGLGGSSFAHAANNSFCFGIPTNPAPCTVLNIKYKRLVDRNFSGTDIDPSNPGLNEASYIVSRLIEALDNQVAPYSGASISAITLPSGEELIAAMDSQNPTISVNRCRESNAYSTSLGYLFLTTTIFEDQATYPLRLAGLLVHELTHNYYNLRCPILFNNISCVWEEHLSYSNQAGLDTDFSSRCSLYPLNYNVFSETGIAQFRSTLSGAGCQISGLYQNIPNLPRDPRTQEGWENGYTRTELNTIIPSCGDPHLTTLAP